MSEVLINEINSDFEVFAGGCSCCRREFERVLDEWEDGWGTEDPLIEEDFLKYKKSLYEQLLRVEKLLETIKK